MKLIDKNITYVAILVALLAPIINLIFPQPNIDFWTKLVTTMEDKFFLFMTLSAILLLTNNFINRVFNPNIILRQKSTAKFRFKIFSETILITITHILLSCFITAVETLLLFKEIEFNDYTLGYITELFNLLIMAFIKLTPLVLAFTLIQMLFKTHKN